MESRNARPQLQAQRIYFKTRAIYLGEGNEDVSGEAKRDESSCQYQTILYGHWYRYKYTVNGAKLHKHNNRTSEASWSNSRQTDKRLNAPPKRPGLSLGPNQPLIQ